MKNEKILLRGGRVILGDRIAEGLDVAIADGRIVSIAQTAGLPAESDWEVVDAAGQYVSPGFIDLHTHGGGGHDFMDGTREAFLGAAAMHARHGTTAMCPTTLSGDPDETRTVCQVYRDAKAAGPDCAFLGLHLEGPYFAVSQKGAQDEKYIRNPSREDYESLLDACPDVVRWSAAPELEGGMEFGRGLRERGVIPSIGHTDADFDTAAAALDNGYSLITHLYSCMPGVHRKNAYRIAGTIEAALFFDGFTVEIIADGCHLPPALLKFIVKCKSTDRICLVTDSIRGAGMPEGPTILGSLTRGQEAIIEDGVAKLPDRTAFAGSVATMDRLVRNMVQLADQPLYEAVKMASTIPARVLGCTDRGKLVEGYVADVVLLDETLHVTRTIAGGKTVYAK